MKVFLISDTHFNHGKMQTYCQRPPNFTEKIVKNWTRQIKPEDMVIHVGDVGIGDWRLFDVASLPGRKILIRGNHDMQHSNTWWMNHGFDFSCDGFLFRNAWISHHPTNRMPKHSEINIHGHLHNAWHGFGKRQPELCPHQRLFSVEYTNYSPVEFEKFVGNPERFLAIQPSPQELEIWNRKNSTEYFACRHKTNEI